MKLETFARGRSRTGIALLLGWLALAPGGPSIHAAEAAPSPLKVATLSTVLADVARNVGGARAQVVEVVKPGVDPHDFQPTPADVAQVSAADLVLVSGKGLEGYLGKLEESAGGKNKFVDIGAALPSQKMKEDGRTVEDPHWWHSVGNVRRATRAVRDALTKASPAGRDEFSSNAAAYELRLVALENEIKLKVAELPRDQRKLVTSHDAFGYFAREYGFTVLPVAGVSPADEASSKKVARLIGAVRQEKVKAVFFESAENPKVLTELTRETGAKVGGELFADGLGAADGPAATYEAMMRHNVQTIVDGLK